MTSYVEKRTRPRSNRQRCGFWARKVLRIGLICFVSGIFFASGMTAVHKVTHAQAKK